MDVTNNASRRRTLWRIASSFVRSRALTAAARLGIADALGDGERSVDELAVACQSHAGALRRLLRTLATMGIVSESQPDRFALTDLGRSLRRADPEGGWAEVVFWGDLLSANWAHLTECVRTGESAWQVMERQGVA